MRLVEKEGALTHPAPFVFCEGRQALATNIGNWKGAPVRARPFAVSCVAEQPWRISQKTSLPRRKSNFKGQKPIDISYFRTLSAYSSAKCLGRYILTAPERRKSGHNWAFLAYGPFPGPGNQSRLRTSVQTYPPASLAENKTVPFPAAQPKTIS